MSPSTNPPNTATVGIQRVSLVLRGMPGSPLVIHSFSEKAKEQIRISQGPKARKAKEPRKPNEEYEAAKYIDSKGRECAPITAIKKSIVSAAIAFDKNSVTKVGLRQAIFVEVEGDRAAALVPIETHDGKLAKGVMREHAVTIGINTRGLTYRPCYDEWQLRIAIEFNPRLVSLEQLLALVDQAGWGVGICEGRPEKSSALGWGRFQRHTA